MRTVQEIFDKAVSTFIYSPKGNYYISPVDGMRHRGHRRMCLALCTMRNLDIISVDEFEQAHRAISLAISPYISLYAYLQGNKLPREHQDLVNVFLNWDDFINGNP